MPEGDLVLVEQWGISGFPDQPRVGIVQSVLMHLVVC